MSTKSATELVAEANSRIVSIAAQEALGLLHSEDAVFVDLRDSAELARDGKIPGAVHVPRGMLEFALDTTLPYYNPVFSRGKRIIFYCASGGRSALAADTARALGLRHVAHLAGGLRNWKEEGGPLERTGQVGPPVPVHG